MRRDNASGESENAPAPNAVHDMPPHFDRKPEISVLANSTLSLVDPENGNALVSLKVPEKFTGGGSILVLSDKLQKGKTYRIYTNPTFDKPVSVWVHNAISVEQVTASGDIYKDVEAGVALQGKFGPGPGMPGHGRPQNGADSDTK